MHYLAIGIILVLLIHLAIRMVSNASITTLRYFGIFITILFGLAIILLLFRLGQTHIASLLSGLMLVAPFFRQLMRLIGVRAFESHSPSRITTRFFDVELNYRDGTMRGTVREGEYKGESLAELSMDELNTLLERIREHDEDSAKLLETYIHYRENKPYNDAGVPSSGPMSRKEAAMILGVDENASAKEVKSAYKRLMQKNHPDQGGSPYLASKINQARDTLLGDS